MWTHPKIGVFHRDCNFWECDDAQIDCTLLFNSAEGAPKAKAVAAMLALVDHPESFKKLVVDFLWADYNGKRRYYYFEDATLDSAAEIESQMSLSCVTAELDGIIIANFSATFDDEHGVEAWFTNGKLTRVS
jgi:hypothetical protein